MTQTLQPKRKSKGAIARENRRYVQHKQTGVVYLVDQREIDKANEKKGS